MLPVARVNHSGRSSETNAFAPIPLAIAKRPVRTQAGVGTLGGKDRAVGRKLSHAFGTIVDAVSALLDLFCALGELCAAALQ
jgi:hypothetical protein